MAVQRQHRRGDRAACEALTPAAAEYIFDTTLNSIRVGSGAKLGGYLLKRWGESYTVAPAQISANQNDYSPTDLALAETLFINSDAARSITGIALGATNRQLAIVNNGSFNITLVDASASSIAANRFSFGADLILRAKATVLLVYSAAASRWLLCADGNRVTTDLPENVTRSGDISPAQLVANTNDWAPTGLSTASVIRASTDASRNLTGLTGGADGREIEIHNVGSFALVFKNQDAGSTAANRFLLGVDITLAAEQAIKLWYDATTSRWRQVGNTAGAAVADGAVTAVKLALSGIAAGTLINGYLDWSVAGSALTVAVKTRAGTDPSASDPVYVIMRGATVTDGKPNIVTLTAALSVVVSSGSSLGTVNATAFRIWAQLFDDAGTLRLAVMNCLSGTSIYPLAGWAIASSTAEGGAGAADSAQVFYTGTAVAAKPYATLGYATWETGLAAAGTWSAAPTRAQAFGPGVPLPGTKIGGAGNDAAGAATGTTTVPVDDTIPQNTEGDQFLSQAYTPTSAANLLEATAQLVLTSNTAGQMVASLFQDTGANAIATSPFAARTTGDYIIIQLFKRLLAAGTASTTFKARAGLNNANTTTLNGSAGSRQFGGVINSFIAVEEKMA